MKRLYFTLLSFFLLISNINAKSLEKMTEALAKSLSKVDDPKVAVLAVNHTDALSQDDAVVIYHRLIGTFAGTKKVTLIERAQLDKVLGELKLQSAGVIISENVQKLGQLSGADFVVLSTANKVKKTKIEINSRIVEAATGKVIAADNAEIEKNWGEEDGSINSAKANREQNLKNIAQWTAELERRKSLSSPPCSDCYYNRGASYHALQDWNSASVDLSRAITIGTLDYPALPWAHFLLGTANLERRKYQDAIAPLKSAIELNIPSGVLQSAYVALLTACSRAGDNSAVIKYSSEASRLFPKVGRFYWSRASAYLRQKDYDKAITDLKNALDLGDNPISVYNLLGWVCFDKGDYQIALEYFEKQKGQEPNPDVYIGLAAINFKIGKTAEAESFYGQAVKLDGRYYGDVEALVDKYFYTEAEISVIREMYERFRTTKS